MDDLGFWKLIDASRLEAGDDVEKQVAVLVRELSRMPVGEIVSFENHFVRCLDKAYDARLWAAGSILDELSDDGFLDFRAWLVSRGLDAFTRCLADPEELATVAMPGERVTAEEMNTVANQAYKSKTGRDDFVAIHSPRSPHPQILNPTLSWKTGEGYSDPNRLREIYPRLWARFGEPT